MVKLKQDRSEALDDLFRAVLALEDREECDLFFHDLFTVQELISFAQRFQVARLLFQGNTYQTIQRQMTISSGTISRINTKFCYGSGGYQLILSRLDKQPPRKTAPAGK